MKVCLVKEVKKRYVPRRRVWKLKDPALRADFENELHRKTGVDNSEVATVEDLWLSLKEDLLASSDQTCGWTKGAARHRVTWWWNEGVEVAVKDKRKLWKAWKQGGDKEEYLKAKRAAKKAVYEAKKIAEQERFGNILGREDQRADLFRIAKQMTSSNRDIVGDNCVKNDNGDLAMSDSDKLIAWQEHYERLLNEEFPWNKDDLSSPEPTIGPQPEIDSESVRSALAKMKKGKASGTSGVVAEMLLASGDIGIERLTKLFNQILVEKQVPDDWNTSVIVNCFKNKGEAVERGNYRGLKLLEHAMKVFERVIEKKIREKVKIDDMQFGFMTGKGTMDAIFVARQLQEKFLENKKELYFAFVDLEKAFDRVPREVVQWSMRKLGVDEWLVDIVMTMYKDSNSAVCVNNIVGKKFGVKVGVHQGSVLSPLLFIMVLEAISTECRKGLPCELLYADDLAIIAESLDELESTYIAWKTSIESKGLRVNLGKTKVMISGTKRGKAFPEGKFPCGVCLKGVASNSIFCKYCKCWVHKRCSGVKGRLEAVVDFKCKACENIRVAEDQSKSVKMGGIDYEVVDQFCYLGDMLNAGGGAEASSIARVRSGWKKFRELLPILTGRAFSHKAKGRLYRACVRSAMLYGSETWPMKEEDIQRICRADMQMIRWMCGVSLRERKTSEELRGRLGICNIADSLRQNRLRWFGHVERMDRENPVSACRFIEVDGLRGRGRPRKTWQQLVRNDLKKLNVLPDLAQDREAWKSTIR